MTREGNPAVSDVSELGFDYGLLIPWIPLVGLLLLSLQIPHVSPLQYPYPSSNLFRLAGLIIVVSAMLTLLDAERLARRSNLRREHSSLSGPGWFALVVIAWPVAFPAYLYSEYRTERPSRVIIGWIGCGLFVAAFAMAWGRTANGNFNLSIQPGPGANTRSPGQMGGVEPSRNDKPIEANAQLSPKREARPAVAIQPGTSTESLPGAGGPKAPANNYGVDVLRRKDRGNRP